MPPGTLIVSGATNPKKEAYSGFDGTTLDERLEDLGAQTLYVIGLATDYCVKQTVLDACRLGFRRRGRLSELWSAEAGSLPRGTWGLDADRALEAMQEAGAIVASSADLFFAAEA